MNSMQKLIIASGVALACALPVSASAGGMAPHYQAYTQLENNNNWALYDAGCLRWNYAQHAWYTRCGLPQNGPIHPAAISVKD